MKSLHRNFRATAAIALAVALGAGALVADVAFADTTETVAGAYRARAE